MVERYKGKITMTTKKEEYIKKTIGEPRTVKELIEVLQRLPGDSKIMDNYSLIKWI